MTPEVERFLLLDSEVDAIGFIKALVAGLRAMHGYPAPTPGVDSEDGAAEKVRAAIERGRREAGV